MVTLIIILGVVLLVLGLVVFILTLEMTKKSKGHHNHHHNSKAGLAPAAIRNSTNPAYVEVCNSENLVVKKSLGDFQAYTPFSLLWAPMENTAKSYRLVSVGLQRLDAANGAPVAVMAVHDYDGSIVNPSSRPDSHANQVANSAFKQCVSFCPAGYTGKDVDGEFKCVSDTGESTVPPSPPKNCATSYMNIKQIFWNPVLNGSGKPIGFIGVGPLQPASMTSILPRTNRKTPYETSCSDTAGNYFGGNQNSTPWVFGVLHGLEDTTSEISVYGQVLNGSQLMVAYPGEEDWLAPSSGLDVSTMGWGLVSAGVDVPQGSGPVTFSNQGSLRMDGYFLQADSKDPFAPKELVGKTLWSQGTDTQFGQGTVVDMRLENGRIWVFFRTTNLDTHIIRFVLTSTSGIAGLDATTTMALDRSFGGGNGFLTLVAKHYVDMMVQYLPVPYVREYYGDVSAWTPGGADQKNVLNRVCVIGSLDHSNTFQLWGCPWNATALENLQTLALPIQKCNAGSSSIPIGLAYSSFAYYNTDSYGTIPCIDQQKTAPQGMLAATRAYCDTGGKVYGFNWVRPLFASKDQVYYCQLSPGAPTTSVSNPVETFGVSDSNLSILSLAATPPFWMAPLGYGPLFAQRQAAFRGEGYSSYIDNVYTENTKLRPFFPYVRSSAQAGWGYAVVGSQSDGLSQSSVKALSGDYMNPPDNAPGTALRSLGGVPSPSSLPRFGSLNWQALGYQTKTAPAYLVALYPHIQSRMDDSLAGHYLPSLDIFYASR